MKKTITGIFLKTACCFGEKMSVIVPEDIRKELLEGLLHLDISADLSVNDQKGLYVGMSDSWNVYKDGTLTMRKFPGRSFKFVWQIRHLAMRVAYFPGCEKNMLKPRFPVRLHPFFGISDDYDQDGLARRSYRYSTLEQLEHETTYFVGGNPANSPLQAGIAVQ